MFEAPKMMYGPRGWADLDDYRLVRDDAEEYAAARDGYFRAGEDAREDLVASGKWVLPAVKDSLTAEHPRRRGRPPKRRGRPPKG
jgi:hypothetical protein